MATDKFGGELVSTGKDKFGGTLVDDSGSPEKPKSPGVIRKAGDLAVGLVGGAVGATKALTDAAGAGNAASNLLDDAGKGLDGWLSPQAQADKAEQSRIMQDAEGKGLYEGVKAGVKAFGVAPLQTMVSGVGSVVPIVAATAATGGGALPAMAAGAATGVAMGAGTAKGAIYDEIKKRGGTEEDAIKAQEYGGANTDQIALGGALGVADALTGVTPVVGGMVRKALGKPVIEALAKGSERGIVGRMGMGALGEMPLEAAQGGQEQVAANLAAQRAGYQAGTWDNVASNATLEALASAGPGAGFGALHKAAPAATANPGPIDPETRQFVDTQPGGQPPQGPLPLTPGPQDGGQQPQESPPGDQIPPDLAAAFDESRAQARANDGLWSVEPVNTQDQPAPIKPSEQMGLDPAAGPLSTAAAIAVDTGMHQSAFAQREADRPQVQDGDITDSGNKPFPSKFAATREAKRLTAETGIEHAPVDLGPRTFVVRPSQPSGQRLTGAPVAGMMAQDNPLMDAARSRPQFTQEPANAGNTGDVRGMDSAASGRRGDQPGAGMGAGVGDSGAAGPAVDAERSGVGGAGGPVPQIARGSDAGRDGAVAPSLTGFKLDGQGDPLVREARNRSLTGKTATDFMGRPSDPLQGAKNSAATKAPQPAIEAPTAVQSGDAKKLPPTDIRMGDTVRKDGIDYVVSGGIDGGIKATRKLEAVGSVTPEETIFLKGDDAIKARIAAQTATQMQAPATPPQGAPANVPQSPQTGTQTSPAPSTQGAPKTAKQSGATRAVIVEQNDGFTPPTFHVQADYGRGLERAFSGVESAEKAREILVSQGVPVGSITTRKEVYDTKTKKYVSAPQESSEKPSPVATVTPAKTKAEQKADLDHLFGVDQKRAAALARIAAGKGWFGNAAKAQLFIAQSGLKDTHKAVKSADGKRWDVVPAVPAGSPGNAVTPNTVASKKDAKELFSGKAKSESDSRIAPEQNAFSEFLASPKEVEFQSLLTKRANKEPISGAETDRFYDLRSEREDAKAASKNHAKLQNDERVSGEFKGNAAAAPKVAAQTIDDAAHQAATSPNNALAQPTDGQKKAGNYAKGHVNLNGLDLSIENPAGSERSGTDKGGKAWKNTLKHHYGYIKGTVGNDKDHVDLFVKPETPLDYSGTVFVIDQQHPHNGKFDEHKVMVGFANQADAKKAYFANYAKGWKGMSAITPMTFDAFKAWVKDGAKNTPVSKDPSVSTQPQGATSEPQADQAQQAAPQRPQEQPAAAGPVAGAPLPNATAPEHVSTGETGVSVDELRQIAAELRGNIDAGNDAGVTHINDAPAKGDIVRLADKAKVYHKDHGWMTPAQAKAEIAKWKENARKQGQTHANADKVVLSLFDLSGEWAKPWEEAGYQVYTFDIQDDPNMGDVNNFSVEFFNDWFGAFEGQDVHAILAACPCTDFAVSGARHFAAKDADGRTVASIRLVKQTMAAIEFFKPAVWALENPAGRIESLTGLPPWRLSFDPNQLGDPYTKKTLIWGRFNADLPIAPVEPTEGSKMHSQYGGKSLKTKNARSVTPEGFAYGFFQANNAIDNPLMSLANKYDRLDKDAIKAVLDAGLSENEIKDLVDDFYFIELDDDAANEALKTAAEEKAPAKVLLQQAMGATGWAAEVAGAGNTIWTKRANKDRYTAILTPETNSMEVTVLVDTVDTQIASFKVKDAQAAADAANKAVADDVAESVPASVNPKIKAALDKKNPTPEPEKTPAKEAAPAVAPTNPVAEPSAEQIAAIGDITIEVPTENGSAKMTVNATKALAAIDERMNALEMVKRCLA